MHVTLSRSGVLTMATDLWKSWWQDAPVTYPNFFIELHYLDFFSHLLKEIEIGPDADVVPVMRSLLEHALKKASKQMEQRCSDDPVITRAIEERRLIVRKHWLAYNSQIQGKKHTLSKELWEDYNHWLLALTLWNGFVQSLYGTFTVHLPEDAYDPDDVLLQEANKPLWGMWMAFDKLGRVFISTANNHQSICVFPFVSWQRYKVK